MSASHSKILMLGFAVLIAGLAVQLLGGPSVLAIVLLILAIVIFFLVPARRKRDETARRG